MVLRYEPAGFAAKSGNHGLTQHSQLITKAINARNHGAKAVVLVNGKLGDGEEDLLTRFGSVSGPENTGIVLVQVRTTWRTAGFRPRGNPGGRAGADQLHQQAGIVRFSRHSAACAERRHRDDARHREQRAGLSARARPTSTSSSARTTIISGAAITIRWRHRRSGRFIPAPMTTLRHRRRARTGASVRASKRPASARHSVHGFCRRRTWACSARREWVKEPTLPLDKAVAMINMDMIGRIKDDKVYIGGVGTGSTFKADARTGAEENRRSKSNIPPAAIRPAITLRS